MEADGTGTLDVEIRQSTDDFGAVDNPLIAFVQVNVTAGVITEVERYQRIELDFDETVANDIRVDYTLTGITRAKFFSGFERVVVS